MLLLASFTGFTGYSLPNDGLSGTGLRIAYSVALSIPLIGRWAAGVFAGGDDFPGPQLTTHLYTLHVYFLPVTIGALIALHLGLLVYQKHTQFVRFWPDYALRTVAALGATLAVLALLATFFEINPVGDYGPYRPWIVMNGAVPDWYAAFLEGALRLGPATEIRIAGHPIPPVFWPGLVLPSVTFLFLLLWPFIEARLTGDRAPHDVLEKPTQVPLRVGVGAALIFEGLLLTIAAGDDQTAATLHVRLDTLVWLYRSALLLGPIVVGLLAARIAMDVRARAAEGAEPPPDAVMLVRNAHGGYEEEEPQAG
jgi:ubiquinol-cytochrome c reductase cytochrome b subunit